MLILASSSPQRKKLLEDIGLSFIVHPSSYEEIVNPDETPEENAKRFAIGKAKDVANKYQAHHPKTPVVLGVDTIVVLEGEITGKSKNEDEARETIKRLINKKHAVISGIALVKGDEVLVESETTMIEFGDMSENEIENFISSGDWRGKSGAFTIQKHGALYIKGIEGDYYNIVGLPLYRLGQMLKKKGIPFYPNRSS